MDPALFNITLAWIEYFNRLAGVLIGLSILITAILAVRFLRHDRSLLQGSIAALLLVVFQGWQGSRVVSSVLEPVVVTLHLFLALILVSILLFLTHRVYHLNKPRSAREDLPRRLTRILFAVTLVQTVFGTQIRSELEMLARNFPLLNDFERLARLGPANNWHIIIGLGITLLVIWIAIQIWLKLPGFRSLAGMMTGLIILLTLSQILIGILLLQNGLPAMLQVSHTWLASLMLGAALLLNLEYSYL
jgi:cytochrome c oxidase assembly protein subunit 15